MPRAESFQWSSCGRVHFRFDLLVVHPFQQTFRSGRIRTVVAQLRRLQSASRRAIGVMDHAPVQIGRHHTIVGFSESGDGADERRAATNDDGGFIATNGAPSKKRLRRQIERFSHVLRDRVILACHGHLSFQNLSTWFQRHTWEDDCLKNRLNQLLDR
jgi:hypothetical protein